MDNDFGLPLSFGSKRKVISSFKKQPQSGGSPSLMSFPTQSPTPPNSAGAPKTSNQRPDADEEEPIPGSSERKRLKTGQGEDQIDTDSDDNESESESDKDDEDEDEDEEENGFIGPTPDEDFDQDSTYVLPVINSVSLRSHTNQVSSLTLDYSGSRLLSGGHDNKILFWDFAGMDRNFKPFRDIEPSEGSPIQSIKWNESGSLFVTSSGGMQAKIFNRDGFAQGDTLKGDPYLLDLSNTKGHISTISSITWDPLNKNQFITGSADSTIRIWDVEEPSKQRQLMKAKSQSSGRAPVTCCSVSHSGNQIFAGCQDGSIQIFSRSRPQAPQLVNRTAHNRGVSISTLAISSDDQTVISRADDDWMRVFDVRNFKSPVHEVQLENYGFSDAIFSPDGSLIVAGTAARKEDPGKLFFYDSSTFRTVHQVDFSSGVTRLIWHDKINQIIVGSANGEISILFDPSMSSKGVLLGINKQKKVRNDEYAPQVVIHNPHSLQLYKAEPSDKRKKMKARKDPIKSKRPAISMQGPGMRTGASLTNISMDKEALVRRQRQDPREALLRYAEDAEKEPFWFGVYHEQRELELKLQMEHLAQEEELLKKRNEKLQ